MRIVLRREYHQDSTEEEVRQENLNIVKPDEKSTTTTKDGDEIEGSGADVEAKPARVVKAKDAPKKSKTAKKAQKALKDTPKKPKAEKKKEKAAADESAKSKDKDAAKAGAAIVRTAELKVTTPEKKKADEDKANPAGGESATLLHFEEVELPKPALDKLLSVPKIDAATNDEKPKERVEIAEQQNAAATVLPFESV